MQRWCGSTAAFTATGTSRCGRSSRKPSTRGYVIICPDYRGSTGYGESFHNEIDYGGYEIDDVMSAVDYLKTLPHVDRIDSG